MRLSTITLALVPAALARPFVLPDLTSMQWGAIQERIGGPLKWASEAVETAEHVLGDDKTQLTIWQQIKDDDKYKTLVKILNWEGTVYKDLDNSDKGYDITFFAPNNDALRRPGHHDDDDGGDDDDDLMESPMNFLAQQLEANPWLMEEDEDDHHHPGHGDHGHHGDHGGHHGDHGGKDDDKKRRKRIFKKIAHAVLKYHILPQAHSAGELAQNSTMATALKPHDGSADGLARRIHIEKQVLPPALTINFISKVKSSSDARNGKFHEVDHPLLPPGSVFEEMFLTSKWLSTTTSAIQRAGGTKYVDWGYDHERSKPGKPKFSGAPLVTFFAPSNDAWNNLPPRLHFYLFSRFGRTALGKLLAFHAVPHTMLHAEIVHHVKHKGKKAQELTIGDDPSFHREFEVHSGLPDGKLKIVVDKTKVVPIEGAVRTTMKVNDVDVKVLDIPASNGAWHVIDKVLCPPHKHKKGEEELVEDVWADWEEWLPAWAEEE